MKIERRTLKFGPRVGIVRGIQEYNVEYHGDGTLTVKKNPRFDSEVRRAKDLDFAKVVELKPAEIDDDRIREVVD